MKAVLALALLVSIAKKNLADAKTSAERKSWEAVLRRLEK